MKRLFSLLLVVGLGLCCCVPVCAEPQETPLPTPTVSAESAILVNGEDGAVYYEKNADEPMGMASTTKLMTALVAIENADPEKSIAIPPAAVGVEGSSVYLVAGEQLTLRQLLYALLLSSANDAATAIAIAISGSVEDFATLMNARAETMGLTNTHFTNPHGLYDENHYTTARELSVIARAVLAVPLLREIVSTYKTTIPHVEASEGRLLVNHNKLLRTYDGAIGMKTGFTKKTGRTLVSAAERNGLTLVAVTLNAPDDWRDHTALLDYGFSRYEVVGLPNDGSFFYQMDVVGGEADRLTLTNLTELTMVVPRDHGKISYTVESSGRFAFAPIREGEVLGTLTVRCDGRAVTTYLVATREVAQETPPKESPWDRLKNFFRIE